MPDQKTILRPYQVEACRQIREHAANGGRGIVLKMATGAGKTACFCDFLIAAHKKETYAVMAVRGKALVHQASERLRREGVPHGIYQGDNSRGMHNKILICSVDTLYRRQIAPEASLLILDECHLTHSDSYYWLLEQYHKAFKIGVSATPNHKKGMTHIGEKIICPITTRELIDQGYLVGGRYFVPYVPDLRGIGKVDGDFKAGELEERSLKDMALTMNAAKVWSENLRGKSTFVYAVSVKHAGELARALTEAGAICEIITGSTKDEERDRILGDLTVGKIDCVVSVGVLTTGVDVPSLEALLCCRPTESYNLWIQILGRGTRPYSGKEHFLCYDLSGNLLKHGPIEVERESYLEAYDDKKKAPPGVKLIICRQCYATFEYHGESHCIACGAELDHLNKRTTGKRRFGLGDDSEVIEYRIEPWEDDLATWVAEAREKGHKKGSLFHKIKGKYGEEVANQAWPRIRALKKWPIKPRQAFGKPDLDKAYSALDEAFELARIDRRI